MTNEIKIVNYKLATAMHLGTSIHWVKHHFSPPGSSLTVPGKIFLNRNLNLTGMEVSVNRLPAGTGMPFLHYHQKHEELYFIIEGQGEFQVDGQIIPVQAGSALRIAPEAKRTWRAAKDHDLAFLVIQAMVNSLEETTIEDGVAVNEPVVWPQS